VIAEKLMFNQFERFDKKLDFLLANISAIALYVRGLELRNHQGSPRVTEESY
jgi:hypothetical protein